MPPGTDVSSLKQKGHVVILRLQLSMLSQILGSIDLRVFGHFPCLSVCVANSHTSLWERTGGIITGHTSLLQLLGLQNLLISGNGARDHGFLLVW